MNWDDVYIITDLGELTFIFTTLRESELDYIHYLGELSFYIHAPWGAIELLYSLPCSELTFILHVPAVRIGLYIHYAVVHIELLRMCDYLGELSLVY